MKNVKILFLDIDGVLNCSTTGYSPLWVRDLDEDKLSLLKEIIDRTGAKILLISSWKEGWYSKPDKKALQSETANYLDDKFAKHDLRITAKVPDSDYGGRGKSILDYLDYIRKKGFNVLSFAILDDHDDDYTKMKLSHHLVKTSFNKGALTKKKAEKVIELLNQAPTGIKPCE